MFYVNFDVAGVEINTGPVARGKWFCCRASESAIHWPGWPVKFWNPISEFTWFILIEYIDIRLHNKHIRIEYIEIDFVFTFYKWASESMVGPVEFRLHWSGGPVGWKC